MSAVSGQRSEVRLGLERFIQEQKSHEMDQTDFKQEVKKKQMISHIYLTESDSERSSRV